jgi:membrane peptidoglycan carboxypeptidase
VLDPAVRSRTDYARPFPVAGTVLLMLALAGAALLFVPPARLVGLVLVLPIGAVLLYVWFRNQEQTNGALTVIGLAVLAVTLGVGVAMTIAARANPTQAGPPIELTSGGSPTRFAGPIHHLAPTQPLAPGHRLEPDNSASTPRVASPTHRPDQNSARTPTEPGPRQPNNNTGTLNAPPSPNSVRPNTDNTPDNNTSSNPTNEPESPDGTDGNLGGSSSTGTDSNPSNSSTGTDSRPSSPRPDYCSLGDVKLNNDGTGDVCGDSDGQGHYL